MDTANQQNQSLESVGNNPTSDAFTRLENDVAPERSTSTRENPSSSSYTSTLRAPKENQKIVGCNMNKSAYNAESGFVSCSSSDETHNIPSDTLRPAAIEYVNFSSSKSFLKVDLKSAIYSHGYLSIWVKITYRIYETISDTDWVGLYYIGE